MSVSESTDLRSDFQRSFGLADRSRSPLPWIVALSLAVVVLLGGFAWLRLSSHHTPGAPFVRIGDAVTLLNYPRTLPLGGHLIVVGADPGGVWGATSADAYGRCIVYPIQIEGSSVFVNPTDPSPCPG